MSSLSTILNNTRNKIAKYGFSKTLKIFFLRDKKSPIISTNMEDMPYLCVEFMLIRN